MPADVDLTPTEGLLLDVLTDAIVEDLRAEAERPQIVFIEGWVIRVIREDQEAA